MSAELHYIYDDTQDSDCPIILEAGEYEVMYTTHRTSVLFGKSPKLSIEFKIISSGPFYGRKIYKYYNIGRIDKKKRIVPTGWHSNFARDYISLFGKPNRLCDIKISSFKGKVFRVTVRTVRNDSKQKLLNKDLRYSVVKDFLDIVAGG